MKLRIDGIDDEITAGELRAIFKHYGRVEEVAIHSDGKNVVYGIVTMPDDDAEEVIEAPRPKLGTRYLSVRVANRSRGPWLSPLWRPPRQYWYRYR